MENIESPMPKKNEEIRYSESSGNIPHGRDEVMEAILVATQKLLLKRNPGEISIREIAKAAGVKHPQIYRHFGTKHEVILAAQLRGVKEIESVVSKFESLEGNIGSFFEAVEKNRFRQIILARAMIDGVDPNILIHQFPIVGLFLELLKKRQAESETENEHDSRILAAFLTATALGWILYEPFLLASTGLDEENKLETRDKVMEIVEEFIRKIC